MSKKKIKTEYKQGRIGQLVNFITSQYKIDENLVRAQLVSNFPELKNKAICANCGGSMAIYTYSVTYLDVQLLCAMGGIVSEKMKKGIHFTEANKVHRDNISRVANYAVASRLGISSKLGLVAKVTKKNEQGNLTHDRESGWLITTRGFDFLKGEPIPRMIKVFHNQIQEHFEEMISINDVISTPENMHNGSLKLFESAGVFIETYQHPQLLAI